MQVLDKSGCSASPADASATYEARANNAARAAPRDSVAPVAGNGARVAGNGARVAGNGAHVADKAAFLAQMDASHEQACRAERRFFTLIAEADRRGVWKREGAHDLAHWLKLRYGIADLEGQALDRFRPRPGVPSPHL